MSAERSAVNVTVSLLGHASADRDGEDRRADDGEEESDKEDDDPESHGGKVSADARIGSVLHPVRSLRRS
jgi:hypothetical protein